MTVVDITKGVKRILNTASKFNSLLVELRDRILGIPAKKKTVLFLKMPHSIGFLKNNRHFQQSGPLADAEHWLKPA